jgi:HAD superfamily hydrolase (TIGR01549 family)
MVSSDVRREKVKGVFFDLDGTLLDSFSSHLAAYQAMFAQFGIRMTKEQFLGCYSPNWYITYDAVGLPKELWEAANTCWQEEVKRHTPGLLPKVKETLARLKSCYRLGLVTSGSKNRVFTDLERTGIESFFETVVTGDDILRPKPSPESLEMAMLRLGLGREEVIYVGDAHADYEMAQAAGVAFVFLTSAFTPSLAGNLYIRLESVGDLLEILGCGEGSFPSHLS